MHTSPQEEVTILSLTVSSLKTEGPETSGQSHPIPDTAAVGCRSTPALLFHMGCVSHHPSMQASVPWECRKQGRGGVYGSQVPSWLCLLACRESLQSLQSSRCRSQFTPAAAPNKLLQKQPGGSNALSGECSHLTKKEPFSAGFPNINTWKPQRAPSDPAVSVPCPEKFCSFPTAPKLYSSERAADDALVINLSLR